MPITLLSGPANAGKARVVLDSVRRDIARGAEPLLIVPTLEDVERYRRELAVTGVALGVTVGRFEELLGEVVARAGAGGELLGEFARLRLLEAIAARRSPGGPSPGYAHALGAFIAELRERRVSVARLRSAVRRAGLAGHALRAADEVEEYESLLSRIKRADAGRRVLAALDALRGSPWLWGARPVHLYGFDDLTRLELDAIQTLGAVVDADVTVSLSFEAGRAAFASRAGAFYELAPMAREHRTLAGRADHYAPGSRAALSHVERALFEADVPRARDCEGVRLLEGADEREELELVTAEIACLLRAGVPPEEIAVGVRSPESVADLLEEVFASAGIPFALARERRFADTATGSALIGLLRCAGGADGELADVLAWLRAPGLLRRPELADRLEAQARREGIRRAEEARALWEREHWPLDAAARLADASSKPLALISLALHELERAFAAPRRREARVLDVDELDEARALSAGRAALEELRELARLAPELAPGSCDELSQSLAALRFRGGPCAPARVAAHAGVVAVTDPLALRARRVRVLFLCRMQAGSFPSLERRPPLLAEEERRRLAQHGGVRLSDARDALAEERYLFYAAASRAQEALVLSWHATAEDGTPRARSQFIDEICELFEGAPATLEAPPPPYAIVDAARAPAPAAPATAAPSSAAQAPPVDAAAAARTQAPSVDAAAAARAPAPGAEETGISAEELLPDGEEHVWSASSLGAWMSCPMRWFVERVLRAEDLDPRGEPLARGLLAHAVLKDTLEALERETGSARVTRANVEGARRHLSAALSARAGELPLSSERERAPALRRRLRADLERYLEHTADAADAPRATPLEPRYLELEFGPAEEALPALDLGGGVRLRGRIDRIDVGGEGEAVVFDYKGRSAAPAAKWLEGGEVQVALYMRAVEELVGLRAAGGFYQPLSGDLRARGVLDDESGVSLPVVASDRRDAAETRELLERAVALAREAAAQAVRGELECRPRTCTPRGGCAYPTICRCAC